MTEIAIPAVVSLKMLKVRIFTALAPKNFGAPQIPLLWYLGFFINVLFPGVFLFILIMKIMKAFNKGLVL